MLRRKLRDESGNALITVIIITLVLAIILGSLASNTIANNKMNQSTIETDKAYLAARSGIEVIKQIALDESKSSAVLNARVKDNDTSSSKDVTIDLGNDMGKATVKVIEMEEWVQEQDEAGVFLFEPDGSPKLIKKRTDKQVKLVSMGDYDGKHYVVSRVVAVNPKKTGDFDLRKRAYTKTGDTTDSALKGGIQGDVIITGGGDTTIHGANGKHPLHKIIAIKNLDMVGTDDMQCELIATGGHLVLSCSATVDTDILVGLKKNIGDSVLNPYFKAQNTLVKGTVKCEGDVLLQGTVNIGTLPVGTDYSATPVLIAGGDLVVDGGSGARIDGSEVTITNEGSVLSSGGRNEINGTAVIGGNGTIGGTTIVYGDVICYGDLTLGEAVTVYGTVYVGGKLTWKCNGNTNKGRVAYAGSSLSAATGVGSADITVYKSLVTSSIANSSKYNGIEYVYATDGGGITANAAVLKSKLDNTFNTGQDLVGADAYVTEELQQSPTPYVTMPSSLASAAVQPINDSVTDSVEITGNCILQGNGTAYGQWYGDKSIIYVNAKNNDIDILVRGDVVLGCRGTILINDGGGAHKVRMFMENGSSLTVDSGKSNASWAFVPVSDKAANKTLDEFKSVSGGNNFGWRGDGSTTQNEYVDLSKMPRFYLLAERTASTKAYATITLNNSGYIPAAVIAPGLTINACNDRTGITEDSSSNNPLNWSLTGATPIIYGLALCDNLDFGGYNKTAIKYYTEFGENESTAALNLLADLSGVVTYSTE